MNQHVEGVLSRRSHLPYIIFSLVSATYLRIIQAMQCLAIENCFSEQIREVDFQVQFPIPPRLLLKSNMQLSNNCRNPTLFVAFAQCSKQFWFVIFVSISMPIATLSLLCGTGRRKMSSSPQIFTRCLFWWEGTVDLVTVHPKFSPDVSTGGLLTHVSHCSFCCISLGYRLLFCVQYTIRDLMRHLFWSTECELYE